jgi:hypothetical protein
MVDAENNTSLASVTRRTVLTGAITTAVVPPRIRTPCSPVTRDPILSLWQDWLSAHAEAIAWSKKAGSLEHAMARQVGFPRVLIPSQFPTPVWAASHGDIDSEREGIAVTEDQRRQLHSDLATQQERWDAASETTGFNAADQNERRAWRKSEELADALFALRAQGLLGVIIKLTLILRTGEAEANSDEHPWPQIRSAYEDLRLLAGVDDLTA